MKRLVCEKCKAPLRKWNAVCYSCGYTNSYLIRRLKMARVLSVLFVISLTVSVIVLCNSLLLLPWQRGARTNKQVILEYAAEHYPDAQFVEGRYNSAKFFVWNNFRDAIVFEKDDVEFRIIAEDGYILADGFPRARAEDRFSKIIYNGFLAPRNIIANYTVDFFSGSEPSDDIFSFNGVVNIVLTTTALYVTPHDVGWLYDFYTFLKENSNSLKYMVTIHLVNDTAQNKKGYYISFSNNAEFANKYVFFAAFEQE